MTKILERSIAVIFFSACAACANIDASNMQQDELFAQKAISRCIDEYVRLSGKDFYASSVDRAYLFVNDGFLDVLFTRGAVGLFETRAEDYSAFLACGLMGSDFEEIFALLQPPGAGPTFIYNEPAVIANQPQDDDIEQISLYLRRGDQFEFRDKMTSRVGDLDTGNSRDISETVRIN